jgi:hypothetical protein
MFSPVDPRNLYDSGVQVLVSCGSFTLDPYAYYDYDHKDCSRSHSRLTFVSLMLVGGRPDYVPVIRTPDPISKKIRGLRGLRGLMPIIENVNRAWAF